MKLEYKFISKFFNLENLKILKIKKLFSTKNIKIELEKAQGFPCLNLRIYILSKNTLSCLRDFSSYFFLSPLLLKKRKANYGTEKRI